MPKKRTHNTQMPREHPKPYQSKLWDHLEEIRAMRHARKMWPEIAEHLKAAHGIEVSYRTVRNFFVRTRKPKQRIPAGFEGILGVAAKPSPAPVPPASVPAPPPVTPEATGQPDWEPVEDPHTGMPEIFRRKLEEMKKNQPKQP
jgi:hypothetical protein